MSRLQTSQAHIGAMGALGFSTQWYVLLCVAGRLYSRNHIRLQGGEWSIQCRRDDWNRMCSGCVSGYAGVTASIIVAEVWVSSETHSCCQSWRALCHCPGWSSNITQLILRCTQTPPLFYSAWKQQCCSSGMQARPHSFCSPYIKIKWVYSLHIQEQHLDHHMTLLYDSPLNPIINWRT